jgi:CRISPR-associated protein Cas1
MASNLLYGKPPFQVVNSVKNRISFAYFEYGIILREANSLIFRQNNLDFDIPVANLNVLLLGTGISITQPAIAEISRWGCSISFVAGGGLGLHSSFLTTSANSAKFIVRQAEIVSNPVTRLSYARRMYAKRWGEENVPKNLSLNKLMMLEGRRVKDAYSHNSKIFAIENFTRKQKVDFDGNDLVNQFLTSANHILYGLVNAVIVSLGLSPALGVIHHGHSSSFTFDIADLYKESIIIPLSFQLASENANINDLRKHMRAVGINVKLIPTIIDDIFEILDLNNLQVYEENKSYLWNNEKDLIDNEGKSLA